MEVKIKIDQFQKESDSWKRILAFLSQENAHLKNRLAESLNRNHTTTELLEGAELFQSRSIRIDEIIRLMQRDVNKLDKLILRDIYEDGITLKEILYKQKKFRKEIRSLESAFNHLKLQFNNYLTEATEEKSND
jgi:hypothetical protein